MEKAKSIKSDDQEREIGEVNLHAWHLIYLHTDPASAPLTLPGLSIPAKKLSDCAHGIRTAKQNIILEGRPPNDTIINSSVCARHL